MVAVWCSAVGHFEVHLGVVTGGQFGLKLVGGGHSSGRFWGLLAGFRRSRCLECYTLCYMGELVATLAVLAAVRAASVP